MRRALRQQGVLELVVVVGRWQVVLPGEVGGSASICPFICPFSPGSVGGKASAYLADRRKFLHVVAFVAVVAIVVASFLAAVCHGGRGEKAAGERGERTIRGSRAESSKELAGSAGMQARMANRELARGWAKPRVAWDRCCLRARNEKQAKDECKP